ncbi:yippee-domain-containing protein [Cryphonectria parasitica EP155]|uniref:Yippee-domain-containing protein n=1 Tax=Cryphonectria parasitica (strain ATCC 38755 / EP155) TaxID=660469 RepID=A0A9P4XTX9_CRYP1|nr:yippee-domain-containing protein [Cryphonectria parasitica EP155]KAF3760620.1 yippee-domain-containing protein [Cryphonectria parasitica EP155]
MFRPSTSNKGPTAPHFPTYLLPSLKVPFFRRRQSSITTASPATDSPAPVAAQKKSKHSASRDPTRNRLARSLPDVLRCNTCGTDIAYGLQIVSKGFTGRHGRALLVSPPPSASSANLVNVTVGRPEPRNLVTGAHVVADINCLTCGVKIGWKYVDAREQAQKYKVGKFILETERVALLRSWEDIRPGEEEDPHRHFYSSSAPAEIVFDSDDEEECEDIFAGVWDAATVAERRNSKASSQDMKKGRITNGFR